MMKRTALLVAMILMTACGVLAQAPAQTPAQTPAKAPVQTPAPAPAQTQDKTDPWLALRFLIGSWQAKTTGGMAQAQAAASYTFRLELRDHVLARHSRSGACASPDDVECQHSDLLYIYPTTTGQSFEALYLDNEGHAIHYGVTTPKPGSVVFLSDAAQPGPQYRLTYTLLEGVMSGQFEFQMPGQTQFTSYLEWSGKRR
jgi:hypothetical protein